MPMNKKNFKLTNIDNGKGEQYNKYIYCVKIIKETQRNVALYGRSKVKLVCEQNESLNMREVLSMKKRILATIIASLLGLGSSMTAFAAPELILNTDNRYEVFDPEYFLKLASQNEDVSAYKGADIMTVYQYYTEYCYRHGWIEGYDMDHPTTGVNVVPKYEENGILYVYQPVMPAEVVAALAAGPTGPMDYENPIDNYIYEFAYIFRTDDGSGLIDADGNGIDDRDPVNVCGYIDLNFNGRDDRIENYQYVQRVMEIQADTTLKPAMKAALIENAKMYLEWPSLMCEHGVLSSKIYFERANSTDFHMVQTGACKQCNP